MAHSRQTAEMSKDPLHPVAALFKGVEEAMAPSQHRIPYPAPYPAGPLTVWRSEPYADRPAQPETDTVPK
jgi:hypothetical protein